MKYKRQISSNLDLWEELTANHLKGNKTYPINAFKKGKTSLHAIDVKEVGDVAGKKLLHLQCHFGMDTLSWARLGAKVTGADFSPSAISAAAGLSRSLGIPARFITCNVLDLPSRLKGKFDIVYASYGALYWIHDLSKWFKVAAHFLKKGGFVYVADGHPFYNWYEFNNRGPDIAKYRFSYFDHSPREYTDATDYADRKHRLKAVETGWQFTISDLVTAMAGAGLRIEFLHEFPSLRAANSKRDWARIGKYNSCPVLFSAKAVKF